MHHHRVLRLELDGMGEFDADGKPLRILGLERCKLISGWADQLKARPAANAQATKDKADLAEVGDSLPIWRKIAAIGESIPDEVKVREAKEQ